MQFNIAFNYLYTIACVQEDLETLAVGCLCIDPDKPEAEIEKDKKMVNNFCEVYYQIMQDDRLVYIFVANFVDILYIQIQLFFWSEGFYSVYKLHTTKTYGFCNF